MYDAFVAYRLQYLLHKRRMKFYRKMYAAALLCEFLQHVGRILNAYFPEGQASRDILDGHSVRDAAQRGCASASIRS